MADQTDEARRQAAMSLEAAYTALGAKEKDLQNLALIQKQAIGNRFSAQAIDRIEQDVAVMNGYAQGLKEEIEKGKDYLGSEAKAALADAIARFNAVIYHQSKALIGVAVAIESVKQDPKGQAESLVRDGLRYGLDMPMVEKIMTSFPNLLLNFGRSMQAANAATEVLDDSEKLAIEKAADGYLDDARERNSSVVDRIAGNSSFSGPTFESKGAEVPNNVKSAAGVSRKPSRQALKNQNPQATAYLEFHSKDPPANLHRIPMRIPWPKTTATNFPAPSIDD